MPQFYEPNGTCVCTAAQQFVSDPDQCRRKVVLLGIYNVAISAFLYLVHPYTIHLSLLAEELLGWF